MPDGCIGTDTLCDFLDGRADPQSRQRVEDHASRCTACRELLSSLARSGPPPTRSVDADVASTLTPGTVVGRYVIEREIGAGGMGVVYAARDPELGRLVAVKVLHAGTHASTQERIRREAQAMARLAHPHVVAVHDVGGFEDRIFVAMEYVAGSTLARWTATPRSSREILDAYFAAGRGLAAAHAAGIVHRDFKPENVFVGHDGRVRVGDFGVARTTDAIGAHYTAVLPSGGAALPSVSDAPDKPPRLTAPGTLLGTPYYIAPELYDGADADPRSDQFSFCVALFTALHGERPFDGDTFTTLASNVRAGRVRRRRAPGVPRRIQAAIRRGLSADPAARFPSLRDLIAELGPAPQRRLGRTMGLAAGAALTAGLAVVAWRGCLAPSAGLQPCPSAPGLAAWTAESRTAIAARFTASGAGYAAAALRGVSDALDRHAARWAQADAAVCRDARAGRTEVELAARERCLEPTRHDAAALIEALAAADRPAIVRAVAAVTALRDPVECADPAVLHQLGAPASPAIGARLDEPLRGLSQARAALATGAFARARQLVQPVVETAHALGDRSLEAEAEFVAGSISQALGDGEAEHSLMNAIWSAEAGRNDAIAARARIRLVAVVGLDRGDPTRALALVPLATAAIARLGGDPKIEAELESALGAIAIAQGDVDAAVGHLETAVALDRRGLDGSLVLAGALDRLATAVLAQGHADRAIKLAEQSRELFERWLGGDHPDVARALNHLGTARAAWGELPAAEAELRRASEICERALGPDDAGLALALGDLARAIRQQGRGNEALELARRAVTIGERALGPAHPDLAGPLIELALALAGADRDEEAEQALRRAEVSLGTAPIRAIPAELARGELLLRQARWRDAAAVYERALAVLGAARGMGAVETSLELGLARAELEQQQPARAVAVLEPLARRRADLPPALRAAVGATLARALWEAGGDRVRARELATRALTDLRDLASAPPGDLAQIEQWLVTHR